MEFCNKGMVRADPPPPVMVKDHKFTFFLDPSLSKISHFPANMNSTTKIIQLNKGISDISYRTEHINQIIDQYKPKIVILN